MNAISRVGFIGLGAMGAPMAGHLRAKGLLAVVGNRTLAQSRAPPRAADDGPVAAPYCCASPMTTVCYSAWTTSPAC